MRLETFHKLDAQHPDWCWSNKSARAIDFYAPTSSKIAKSWEIIYFFCQQPPHLLEVSGISFKLFDWKCPTLTKSGSCIFFLKLGSKSTHNQYLRLPFWTLFRHSAAQKNADFLSFFLEFWVFFLSFWVFSWVLSFSSTGLPTMNISAVDSFFPLLAWSVF